MMILQLLQELFSLLVPPFPTQIIITVLHGLTLLAHHSSDLVYQFISGLQQTCPDIYLAMCSEWYKSHIRECFDESFRETTSCITMALKVNPPSEDDVMEDDTVEPIASIQMSPIPTISSLTDVSIPATVINDDRIISPLPQLKALPPVPVSHHSIGVNGTKITTFTAPSNSNPNVLPVARRTHRLRKDLLPARKKQHVMTQHYENTNDDNDLVFSFARVAQTHSAN